MRRIHQLMHYSAVCDQWQIYQHANTAYNCGGSRRYCSCSCGFRLGTSVLFPRPLFRVTFADACACKNGNLENTKQLNNHLNSIGLYQNGDMGDSELILELMLSRKPTSRHRGGSGAGPVPRWIVEGLEDIYAHCIGSFACVFFIPSYGLVACRDANGIKPIIVGERRIDETRVDYMFTSESVTFCNLGYTAVGDIRPG